MKNEDKIFLTMDEISDDFQKFKLAQKDMFDLVSKIYGYSSWATNVSIGLLGFFIVVLIQLKSQNALFGIYFIYAALFILVTSIILGFILKFRYEHKSTISAVKSVYKNIFDFLDAVMKKFGEKGEDINNLDISIKEYRKAIDSKLIGSDADILKPPTKLIYSQFILVLFSILYISIYLFIYIFLK